MAESAGDRTHDPTPHRRQQAREEGQVAKSQDLSPAGELLVGLASLLMLGGPIVRFFLGLAEQQLGSAAWLSVSIEELADHWNGTLANLAWVLLPLLGVMLLAAITLELMQVGFLFLPERLLPDVTRIDPLRGFQRVFSLASWVRLGFGLFKLAIVGGVAYGVLHNQWRKVLELAGLEIPQLGTALVDLVVWTAIKIAAALLVLALLEYGFQWWKHEQDLKMTTEEVKEELRNLQGDPQIIARRRQVQRQLVLNRLGSAVPKADVVVTNPTELAVAIQYDAETMRAPIVVAKGAGVLAQRIRRLALEHGIPIVEKKPLAQALYKEVEVNHPIKSDMYAAVAEILAYVYQLKGKPLPKAPAA